ncbi:TMEM165/GDT1 family protein [Actinomarinicola tropica]|uniref:GDT1 family protein n=1 Tax=Actinomarinicola tropica TaxID=2789776 RepID=A0A5Q2RLN9_9ACTN|nr:TMEM165/GDT1 family protein [Actinomarinicola tropica]QGG96753.1 UPF0016 domain-containing protein [Actinomarinicola tropica]
MDAVLLAFAVVFLAELGDKTQLVALGLAARYPLGVVVVGIGAAYAITQGLAALLGGALGAALPTTALGIGGAVVFLAFAVWTAVEALRGEDPSEEVEEELADVEAALSRSGRARSSLAVVGGIVGAMVVAEIGDKSMLATATIAAERGALGAWIGATLGITASGGLAVLVGRWLGTRLDPRVTGLLSAAFFALFGVVLLVETLA